MSLLTKMREENGSFRARLGAGEPGLNILLGGTLQDDEITTTFSGPGSVSATYRLAVAHKDVRLAAVASGGYSSGAAAGGQGNQGKPRPQLK